MPKWKCSSNDSLKRLKETFSERDLEPASYFGLWKSFLHHIFCLQIWPEHCRPCKTFLPSCGIGSFGLKSSDVLKNIFLITELEKCPTSNFVSAQDRLVCFCVVNHYPLRVRRTCFPPLCDEKELLRLSR